MKKTLVLILVGTFIHVSVLAQFSFRVFPVGVSGDPFADTLLNTRAILKRAGIKQFNSYQTSAELTKTFVSKSVNLDSQGRIQSITSCFAKNKITNFTFCIHDTIFYAASGFREKIKMSDNKGNKYSPIIFDYQTGRELVILQDSIVSKESYNDSGQLAVLRRTVNGREVENSRFYYNADGLLDSTHNSHWGTFKFNRRKQRKGKRVEMENTHFIFSWVYNKAGQCIRQTVVAKERPNVVRGTDLRGDLKTEINYYYNADGTLLQVTTKSSELPSFTVQYTYIKY